MCKWLKKLICIGVLVSTVYAGMQFGMPYYRYSTFKSSAEEIIKFSVEKESNMRDNIMKEAEKLHIPLAPENLEVVKEGDSYKANAKWSETVKLLDFYQKKLDFSIEVKG